MIADIFPLPSLDAILLQAERSHKAGQLSEAEQLYRAALNAHPEPSAALNGLGRVLQAQGKLAEAGALFRRLTGLRPDIALGWWNLGVVLCETGSLEESFAAFRRYAELNFSASKAATRNARPPHMERHDREQQDFLGRRVDINFFHTEDGNCVAGRAVNPDASSGGIALRWQNSRPRIVVIDNLLSEPALQKLRHYCWGSTIWRAPYEPGYIGAMPQHGIGSPLLAQIATELRATYPHLIGQHPLLQFWGFKYDSKLGGIAVHADFAAVNVNFWITPDDANLDPDRGGLIVWDAPAPPDWDFARYNDDVEATRDFLKQSGARPTVIPYRSNRAVIFDSSLFHETDKIIFREGYLNRRINLTLLYGRRESS